MYARAQRVRRPSARLPVLGKPGPEESFITKHCKLLEVAQVASALVVYSLVDDAVKTAFDYDSFEWNVDLEEFP